MRSLRGRLVAILLLVATFGLIVLAAITYAEQRSFLNDRVDRQVQSAFTAANEALAFSERIEQLGGTLPESGATPGYGLFRVDPRTDPNDGPGPRGGPPGLNLPPGTFAAQVDAQGNVLTSRVFAYRDSADPARPDLSDVTLTNEPQTVPASGDSDLQYRAAAERRPDGTSIVVAIPLTESQETLNRLLLVEATVIAGVLLLLGIVSWLIVGVALKPLDEMGETADAIAGGDLSRRVEPADERSEIGRLGLALNRMLHSLEEAFDERRASENKLRQFLADASHELRTPLVSIRGYAELYRLGATPDEEEVKRSMDRIEQESERMGVLVEDMLTLARLDETREQNFEPVDLARIAKDAVNDAEVAAPGRSITLTSPSPQSVNGDAHQLQQVLANLLRNAIVHTPDGTPIEVKITGDGSETRLDVRDHGPGLPDGAGDDLFERFWRAEAGRERGKAGSGLGLSIVAGIVQAHGGRVQARNAEGGGAEFSVWLPASEQAQQTPS